MKDPIADMLIKIKNAGLSKKETVSFPYSKLKLAILDVLAKTSFVKSVTKKGKKVVKSLEVALSYHQDGSPKISEVKRVSKTSKRVYVKSEDIYPVRNGFGVMILSTNKGIMTGDMAKKEKVGGEVICNIW